ncbi:hypothetical protein CC1G_04162 [Coprinopsis cinerea okayama7|uniref:NodB homology domain-containing protein n=1 Tax=Coprinopsis cinerea (strain Okayama-7 / 130 / ATCC MYA-4618 / FGSC 9003) TaxID=240176 RepID=A8NW76_COPC7|nr:hypothetical protein CC1G_04162 [Coprinopsis cinerea okayama7\|eukprot:XP_001836849.2 hypothetical protein CC1G_04162 [Coprinopsis cinerea okayama7\
MANYSFLTFFSFLSVLLASSSLLANASPISGLDLGLPEDCEAQVLTKCTVPNTVALTFDDGPYVYLKQVLDTLNEEGIKGTFFFSASFLFCLWFCVLTVVDSSVPPRTHSRWMYSLAEHLPTPLLDPQPTRPPFTNAPHLSNQRASPPYTLTSPRLTSPLRTDGNNFACIYSEEIVPAVKYAFETGHEIASHTWGHKNLSTLSWDEIHHEMFLVERALEKIVGVTPALMRPPFGEHNLLVRQASKLRGQTIVNWDFDSEDARAASVEEQKALYDEVVARRPESILSLQHEVHESSVYVPSRFVFVGLGCADSVLSVAFVASSCVDSRSCLFVPGRLPFLQLPLDIHNRSSPYSTAPHHTRPLLDTPDTQTPNRDKQLRSPPLRDQSPQRSRLQLCHCL